MPSCSHRRPRGARRDDRPASSSSSTCTAGRPGAGDARLAAVLPASRGARASSFSGVNYRGGAGYGRAFREVPTQGAAGASEFQDVLAAAEYLRNRPDVDPARIGIWGASYGGYLTQLALARRSDVFAAGVTECGIFDLAANARPTQAASGGGDAARRARESSAIGSNDQWKSPVLVVHGDDDAGVDFNTQTVALVRALRAHGVALEQLVFPDEGHGLVGAGPTG